MELRHLRYFLALAERLNFTHAAEKVHVTQSTLSHQIRQLEEEVGCRLFDRAGKRVRLTTAGETFVTSATKALREIDDGVREMKGSGRELIGLVRIGATHTFNINIIPACLATFLTENPLMRVTVEELPATAIETQLRSGGLDIGISYRPTETEGLSFEPLYNEEMLLAVAPGHVFAERKRIRMVELHRQSLVLLSSEFMTRKIVDECLASVGAEPTVIAETNTIASMIGLVQRMDTATIVSEHAVYNNDGIRTIALESPTPMRTPGLLWRKDDQRPVAVMTFASIVRQAVTKVGTKRGKGIGSPSSR
jgi:LysR family cyn operon transcriptional activator